MRFRYILQRALQLLPMVLAVITLNFLIIHLTPGDPAYALAGENAPEEYLEAMRQRYGLTKSLPEQFLIYVGQLLQGDLGTSYFHKKPVTGLILGRIPATLLLIGASTIPSVLVGVWLGVVSVRHHGRWPDKLIAAVSLAFYSVPVFWTGIMLILLLSVRAKIFPSSGISSFDAPPGFGGVVDVARHLVLPATALFLYHLPTYIRLTRATLAGVMRESYIQTARTVGFSGRRVLYHYALRNALLPTVTHLGLSIGFMFSGALLTETVFAWPGMGRLMFEAVFQRDYPVVMGVFLLTAICVAVMGLITDIVYTLLDPRVSFNARR